MALRTVSVVEPLNEEAPGPEAVKRNDVLRIAQTHEGERGGLIATLEGIQDAQGYLSEEALRTVADATGLSLVDVYGVATFYHGFSLQPRGNRTISVCLGTACHVRGAPMVVEEFERQLGVRAGGTTVDLEFTLETVNCLGACALGPIVKVDGTYFSNVSRGAVKGIIEQSRAEQLTGAIPVVATTNEPAMVTAEA